MIRTLSRLWHRRSNRTAPTTSTTLVIDTEPFSEQMRRIAANWDRTLTQVGRALQPMLTGMAEVMTKFARQINPYIRANTPVNVAGLEARYFVRAGLDPAYADPWMLDRLVQGILTGVTEDELWFVNDENRALIAASAITGWCASYAGLSTVQVLAWHRQMPDGGRLSVGRAS